MTNPNILSSDENEQNVSAVKLWVERFSQTGEVGEIDVNQVREVLKTCGAKVEVSADSITRLQGYSEATRGKGLTEVWGKERKKEFKAWTEEQGTKYETEKGITLPTTKVKDQKTGIEKEVKTFGMRGYLE